MNLLKQLIRKKISSELFDCKLQLKTSFRFQLPLTSSSVPWRGKLNEVFKDFELSKCLVFETLICIKKLCVNICSSNPNFSSMKNSYVHLFIEQHESFFWDRMNKIILHATYSYSPWSRSKSKKFWTQPF